MKDYNYILGVNKNASLKEIKDAYRKLSKKYHPDLNNGDIYFEERFKEIQEAYEYLVKKNNPNPKGEEYKILPKIISFYTDEGIYNVGDTINLIWESTDGSWATINLFGNVTLSGNKRFTIKTPKENLELVLTVKNDIGSVSKKINIQALNRKDFDKTHK